MIALNNFGVRYVAFIEISIRLIPGFQINAETELIDIAVIVVSQNRKTFLSAVILP